jgi:hypothetical protein
MRPNRAAVTPIGQQNPLEPLKLLGLRGKTGKNTDFDFAQITLNILVYMHVVVCMYCSVRIRRMRTKFSTYLYDAARCVHAVGKSGKTSAAIEA